MDADSPGSSCTKLALVMVLMYDLMVIKAFRYRMYAHESLFYCQIYLFPASSPRVFVGVHLLRGVEVYQLVLRRGESLRMVVR